MDPTEYEAILAKWAAELVSPDPLTRTNPFLIAAVQARRGRTVSAQVFYDKGREAFTYGGHERRKRTPVH
jgi:hypothetical protein